MAWLRISTDGFLQNWLIDEWRWKVLVTTDIVNTSQKDDLKVDWGPGILREAFKDTFKDPFEKTVFKVVL